MRRWRGPLAAIAAAGVLLGVYYAVEKGPTRSAINRWTPTVCALWQGRDIYRADAFPTPPIMAIVLTPFASLPGRGPMVAWFAFKLSLAIGCVVIALAWAQRRDGPMPVWGVWLGLAIACRPISGDLLHGNVNLWILALSMAGTELLLRGRPLAAGLTVALAACCKLTPALLLVYFAWKGAWRAVAAGLVGVALWWFVVPGALLGVERNATLLDHWADAMVWPYLGEGRVDTEHINQSLPGLIHRLLTPSMAIKPESGSSDPVRSINVLSLSAGEASRVVGLASLLVVGLLAWRTRPRRSADDPRRRGSVWTHEFCLVLLAAFLLSERSWKHHFQVLVPSALLLLSAVGAEIRPRGRWLVGSLVAAATLLVTAAGDLLKPFLGDRAPELVQAWGAYTLAAALLATAHAACLTPTERAGTREIPLQRIAA